MHEKLMVIPGYKPTTISQKLGLPSFTMSEETDPIQTVFKAKAEAQEVRRLLDEKTNKVDTESQMRYLEIMHRMLGSVAVLLTEITRLNVNKKPESETSKALTFKSLHD